VTDFHTETASGRGPTRLASAARDRSHATAPNDTDQPRRPFRWRDASRSDATEDLVLTAGQDTEAEAKGCYPTDRTAKAALSAHTDGKCTGRRRPH